MKAAKLALAVVLFAAAAVLGVRAMTAEENDASMPDRNSFFKCADCGHAFSLSEADLLKTKSYLVRGDSAATGNKPGPRMLGVDRARREVYVLQCTNAKCGHYAARVAYRCPKDTEVFIARSDEGEPQKCPKCGAPPGG